MHNPTLALDVLRLHQTPPLSHISCVWCLIDLLQPTQNDIMKDKNILVVCLVSNIFVLNWKGTVGDVLLYDCFPPQMMMPFNGLPHSPFDRLEWTYKDKINQWLDNMRRICWLVRPPSRHVDWPRTGFRSKPSILFILGFKTICVSSDFDWLDISPSFS